MPYEMCLLKRIDNHRDHNKIRDLQFCFQLFWVKWEAALAIKSYFDKIDWDVFLRKLTETNKKMP